MVNSRRPRRRLAPASALMAAALAGCSQVQEPPGQVFPPQVALFGTGDTLAYVHDSARFAVRLFPPVADVESYTWWVRELGSDSVLDSAVTRDSVFARAWPRGGRYSIGVEVGTRDYGRLYMSFPLRVDSGRAEVILDTAHLFPFGGGNRFRVQARDPDGTVVKYFWSTQSEAAFTDSTDGPEWDLPDALVDDQRLYCRVRDDKGIYSRTAWKSLRFLPRVHGSVRDDFRGLALLPEGGFLAAGRTQTFDSRLGEPWVARLDAKGALEAATTVKRSADFGVFGSGEFHAIAAGAGSAFVAAGSYRDSTHDDGLIAGFDAAGGLQWRHFVGDSGNQVFRSGVQADAGRHVVVGTSVRNIRNQDSTEALVAAVSPEGELLYTRSIRRGRRLAFQCIARAADGNLMVGAAATIGASGQAGYLFKLTPDGDTLWSRPLEPPGTAWLSPHYLMPCRGGGFALLAFAYGQTVLQRMEEDGALRWTRILSAVPEAWPRSGSLAESPEGDILAVVDPPSAARPPGFLLTLLDAGGTVRWSRQVAREQDELFAVAALPAGGFAAAGSLYRHGTPYSTSAAWIFRFDAGGNMLW